MSLAHITSGYFISPISGGGGGSSLTISNVTPTENVQPGTPGGFAQSYPIARLTPIEFDLSGLTAGMSIAITAKFPNQEATYSVVDFDSDFCWPFDDGNSTIGSLAVEPVHVSLLPRDGWPPGVTDIEVAAFVKGTE